MQYYSYISVYNMKTVRLFIVGLILTIVASHEGGDPKTLQIYSSCIKATKWRKGAGLPISSWISSIVPMKNSPKLSESLYRRYPATVGAFVSGEVRRVQSSRITWTKVGEKDEYGGWYYGGDENGTGEMMAFIYGDFSTVLLGSFRNFTMTSAKATKITGYRCRDGVMELKIASPSKDSPDYKFEDITDRFLTSQPQLMDPLEKRNVYIADSRIPSSGDGVFAKRDFLPGDLILYYAGVKVFHDTDYFFDNQTVDEMELAHTMLMSYDDEFELNLPVEYHSVVKYRATLGHKTNHKFDYNTDFDYAFHPRFGHIRCIRVTRPIKRHEELFINYNYDINNFVPRWYAKLYKQYFKK